MRRQQFGRSSEKIDRIVEQLELMLDELETEAAVGLSPPIHQPRLTTTRARPCAGSRPAGARCPSTCHAARSSTPRIAPAPHCGGAMRKVGEDVSEVLDYIPGRFEVIRHIRPAFSCRVCERMVQRPMPSLPVERGRPSAGLLAHILVSKYCDHTPLYRQAGISMPAKGSISTAR